MTIQTVRRDGYAEIFEDVTRIEIDETDGKRLKVYRPHTTTELPCIDFVSITVIRYDSKEF